MMINKNHSGHVILFFQGQRGTPGSTGLPGPPGEKVVTITHICLTVPISMVIYPDGVENDPYTI